MIKARYLTAVILCLTACSSRGALEFAPPTDGATLHQIWVANFRTLLPPSLGQKLPPRSNAVRYEAAQVSVPPTHEVGQIEWPTGAPDAKTDFVTTNTNVYRSPAEFAAEVDRADIAETNETLLFVHGYNYTHGEAVYQTAQIAKDYEVPSPTVLFSWPSAATPLGYLYDRDSVLIARDQLEETIIALTRKSGRRVTLMGHSMGNFLIMETLRQIEISGSVDIARKISGLIMVSPDIDGELFHTQAARLQNMPHPSIIIATKQDSALRLSAFLTGRSYRLGSETDRRAVRDLPIVVIDASALSTRGINHDIALTSPAAIAILKNLNATNVPGEISEPLLLKITDLR